MWSIQSTVVGDYVYPKHSTRLKGSDRNRFAKYVIHDTARNIEIPLHMYLPLDTQTFTHVIFSIHGIKRDAVKYRNIFVPHVQDKNVLIVAPAFVDPFYHSSLSLKMGNMCNGIKDPKFLLKDEWTFTHLYEIFSMFKKEFPNIETFSLFGHSAGAQFVHRMAMFTNYSEMTSAVAANAGWYTLFDTEQSFPYGLGNVCDTQQVINSLNKRVLLVAGDADTEQDKNLRVTKKALMQGQNRYERAQYAFSKANKLAQRLGTRANWSFLVVPDVAHSSRSVAPAVLEHLL